MREGCESIRTEEEEDRTSQGRFDKGALRDFAIHGIGLGRRIHE